MKVAIRNAKSTRCLLTTCFTFSLGDGIWLERRMSLNDSGRGFWMAESDATTEVERQRLTSFVRVHLKAGEKWHFSATMPASSPTKIQRRKKSSFRTDAHSLHNSQAIEQKKTHNSLGNANNYDICWQYMLIWQCEESTASKQTKIHSKRNSFDFSIFC